MISEKLYFDENNVLTVIVTIIIIIYEKPMCQEQMPHIKFFIHFASKEEIFFSFRNVINSL